MSEEPLFLSQGQTRLFPVPQEQLTSDDYYTPKWIFDRMNLTFDLDVCSPPGGVPWIPATHYYTQADDGLTQPWTGRVWMNPPFSGSGPWVRRFIAHAHGVCIVPASNGDWFQALWDSAHAITSQLRNEMKFHVGDSGIRSSIPVRVMMAAFGDECIDAIARLGVIRRAG